MQVTSKSRRRVRLQNILFVILLLGIVGLAGWLGTRYQTQWDWTAGARRTLSDASVQLLKHIQGPIMVTAYVSESRDLRRAIGELVGRYQRHKQDVQLTYVDPVADPERTRAAGVTADGELLIQYQGRTEHVRQFELTEENITNALQRVARAGERWVVFLEGHGERRAQGQANHDLGTWAQELTKKGYKVHSINLADTPVIPDNTAALVLAGAQVDLLAGEVQRIKEYVDKGGNLLWLGDPGPQHGLEPLAQGLGVRFHPGVIVDPTTQLFSVNDPTFAIVANYGASPITRDFQVVSLFPQAAGVTVQAPAGWEAQTFLASSPRSWSETGPLRGELKADAADPHGPLDIGVSLTRPRGQLNKGTASAQQRIAVLGDGDFLANAYVGNAGNLDLGLRIINWLSSDDALISVPAKTAPDVSLNLSPVQSAVISLGFVIGLPLLLVGSGVLIWWRRRKR